MLQLQETWAAEHAYNGLRSEATRKNGPKFCFGTHGRFGDFAVFAYNEPFSFTVSGPDIFSP